MPRLVVVLLCLVFASPSLAEAPVLPSRELAPEDVISIQLKALSEAENNTATKSGIERVWAFAHPLNKAQTGPLARFTLMLKSPQYRPLIGHRDPFMREVKIEADNAHYAIKVTASNGTVYGYSWHLGKVTKGAYKDMWMTTGVALIGKLGKSL